MKIYYTYYCIVLQADEPSYDVILKMEYLDMVWCETLRKYPLAST